MPLILKSISLTSAIRKKQTVSVYYKLASDPDVPTSYALIGTGIVVDLDGTFTTPIVINTARCTGYTVWIVDECSGQGFKKDFITGCYVCFNGCSITLNNCYVKLS